MTITNDIFYIVGRVSSSGRLHDTILIHGVSNFGDNPQTVHSRTVLVQLLKCGRVWVLQLPKTIVEAE